MRGVTGVLEGVGGENQPSNWESEIFSVNVDFGLRFPLLDWNLPPTPSKTPVTPHTCLETCRMSPVEVLGAAEGAGASRRGARAKLKKKIFGKKIVG